ncbi:MAG TPA: CBS domain-containing protein, partial [Caldithrix sp.]|nr:CBS domain-containing protein [Caldithrix sp.]
MIVENWMTRDVITVSPEDTLDFISEIFEKAQIRRVPVVFNHKVVGIVT